MLLRPADSWAGVLVDTGSTIVAVDAGPNPWHAEDTDYLLLTHAHLDHVASLDRYSRNGAKVLCPDDVRDDLGLVDSAVGVKKVKSILYDVIVHPIPVEHTCSAYAYVLDLEECNVLVTGDWHVGPRTIDGEIKPLWKAVREVVGDEGVDVIVSEATRALVDAPELGGNERVFECALSLHDPRDVLTFLQPTDLEIIDTAFRVASDLGLDVVVDSETDRKLKFLERRGDVEWEYDVADEPLVRSLYLTVSWEKARELAEAGLVEAVVGNWATVHHLRRRVGVKYAYVIPRSGHASRPEITRLITELEPSCVVFRHRSGDVTRLERYYSGLVDEVRVWVGRGCRNESLELPP